MARRALHFVFPPRCMGCGDDAVQGGGLCGPCFADIHVLAGACCDRCGQPQIGRAEEVLICETCRRYPPPWGRGAATLDYSGTGRRLVLALKHGDRLDLAPQLSVWMARNGAQLLAEADVIAPIPLHWRRLLRRSYNQSAELVRHLPTRSDVHKIYDLLTRPQPTRSQDGLSRAERRENLRGRIAVDPRHASLIKGKRLLLVDDVLTTGATLSAATEAALAAGAANVNVLVLARVAPPE